MTNHAGNSRKKFCCVQSKSYVTLIVPSLEGVCFLKKTYKKLVKFKKNQFKNDLIEAIQSLGSNNPKEYWKLVEILRSATTNKTQSQSNIYPEEWLTYFKTLNNPQTGVNNPFDEGVEFFTTHSDKFSSVYTD